jgi:hypothetical protein
LEFEGVEKGALGGGRGDQEFGAVRDVCESAKVGGEFDLNAVSGHEVESLGAKLYELSSFGVITAPGPGAGEAEPRDRGEEA